MLAESLAEATGGPVSRETAEKVKLFATLLLEANRDQNLISKASEDVLVERHLLDSAQLLRFDRNEQDLWADVGSGPGLPGMVLAMLRPGPVVLIEPRPLRTRFLAQAVERLRLVDQVEIFEGKVERFRGRADVITARAVTSLERFLRLSRHLSTEKTRWVLPKGRKAMSELEVAKRTWQADFRVEPSLTDPDAKIVLVERLKGRARP